MKNFSPPRGLIVNLALPAGEEPVAGDFLRLINMVSGKVSGILIDPLYWAPTMEILKYQCLFLERCLEIIPPELALFIVMTGHNEDETRENFLCLNRKIKGLSEERPIYLADLPLAYHSNRGLPDYYRELLSGTDVSLVIINDPEGIFHPKHFFKRKNIIPSVLRKLADVPNIRGLINSSDLKRSLSYSWIMRDQMEFRIYDGKESFFLENPSKSGLVSITANLFPSSWRLVIDSSLGTEDLTCFPDQVKERWYVGRFLQEIAREIEAHAPIFIRYVLNYWGIFQDPPRSYPNNHFETQALHFVRNHPEPDKIHPL